MLGPTESSCLFKNTASWTSSCKGGEQAWWYPLAQRNIGKPYCLPTLMGWTVWPIYMVRNVKAIERSDLYDMCCLSLMLKDLSF